MLQCLINKKCTCLHKTVNMVVFFVKSNENTYPKGRALMQLYGVVPKTKRRRTFASFTLTMILELLKTRRERNGKLAWTVQQI